MKNKQNLLILEFTSITEHLLFTLTDVQNEHGKKIIENDKRKHDITKRSEHWNLRLINMSRLHSKFNAFLLPLSVYIHCGVSIDVQL